MLARITLTVYLIACAVHADDLDIIVSYGSPNAACTEAYSRLAKADFASIAFKLLLLISTHPVLTGCGPSTNEPWKEARLRPGDRIGCTLWQLWEGHTSAARQSREHLDLYFNLLEYAPAGDSRSIVFAELRSRLSSGSPEDNKSLLGEMLPRLDRLVRDRTNPISLRRELALFLFTHSDPSEYADLLNAVVREESNPRPAEALRFAIPGLQPVVPGVDPLRSDFCSPGYDQSGNLRAASFQDAVNDARKWLDEHKAEYR